MDRRSILTTSGVVLTGALAGCLAGAGSGNDGNPPSGDGEGDPRTISVSGTGTADTEPDLAVVRIGVEATGDDVRDVRTELAANAGALEDALRSEGVDEDAITTDRFRIRERIDEQRMRADGVEPETREEADEYVYYEGTHAFRVEIDRIDEVGTVIDAGVDAGADDVGRIEFTLADETRDELREEALEEAVGNARSEADVVATEVDATILDVLTVDTDGGGVTPVRGEYAVDSVQDDATPSTDLHYDDVTVTATVDVVYEIG